MKNNSDYILKNRFYRFYLAGFLLILALPLLNLPIYFSPPNWAKTFAFQIVFSIILFIFLCHLLWQRKTNLFNKVKKIGKENLAFWFLLLLFAAQLLATIFSVDFRYSFFGSPYRAGGFINYGFYILFAAITFLIVKHKDWQKLWDFAILIGILVSVFALVSLSGLFSDIVITRIDNISSTIGGPNTLALYLLLLVFPALSLGIAAGNKIKKLFYLSSVVLFSIIIILTISQGAYLGLAAGMGYFLIFYPTLNLTPQNRKKMLYGKLVILCLATSVLTGVLLIKNNPSNPINKHYLFRQFTTWKIDQSRLATWKVSMNAFFDRPILGYGLENFSIGFDRNFDPSLSSIQMEPNTPASWWDKAHNFALNLLVETGVVGFLPFALLFGFLFWGLQKIKRGRQTEGDKQPIAPTETPNAIIPHGLQTALVAYFTNLMFNFENFASYTLVFLIVGYSLSLTVPANSQPTENNQESAKNHLLKQFFFKNRKLIAGIAFVVLVCFIWFFNIKTFKVNAQINRAVYLADGRMCSQALAIMEKELKNHSIIDGYLRIKYIDIIRRCIQHYPENDLAYAKLGIEVAKENTNIMPYYTRNWLWISAFNNMLAVSETNLEKKKAIIDQNREYLKKAEALSPNRHEILVETINFEIFEGNYEKARQISEDCTKKYPDFNACYWYLGLSQIYLAKDNVSLQEGKKNMEKAQNMGYSQISQHSLTQLAFLYINKNNYQELEWVYERLTQQIPHNPRYFGGLALIYKRNGKLEKSEKALKEILRIQSDARSIERGWAEEEKTITLLIENILGLKESSPEYHLTLYKLQLELGNLKEAENEANRYYNLYTQRPEVKNNQVLLADAKNKLDTMLKEIERQKNNNETRPR